MTPTPPLKAGDIVWLTVGDHRVRAIVTLASHNGWSLMVQFDAMLDGCVCAMALMGVLSTSGLNFHNLITGRPVLVERATDADADS